MPAAPEPFRLDVYADHPDPDQPQQEPGRIDSAADVLLACAALASNSDVIE